MGLNHNTCRICGKDIPDKGLFCNKCRDNITRKNKLIRRVKFIKRISDKKV